MGVLYFVRHGESQWNVEDKICGVTDSPLTEKGQEQAAKTGMAILEAKIHADIILYSPLQRAADTALKISEITGIPAKEEPRLIEQNFGIWEGTSPRNSMDFYRAKLNFINSFERGESMFRVAQRIYNLIDDIEKEPEKTYLLVAHNGISRMIESYFRDMRNEEFAAFGIKNAEVREYKFEDSFPDYHTDYDLLCRQLKSLMQGVDSDTTILSNASALIYQTLQGINWAGVYISQGNELLLGPFQGKPACVRIPFGKGVCGTAAAEGETVLVENVHEFAGHIACDSDSRSEIVLPICKKGSLYGVLDIDSPFFRRFSTSDRDGLEQFAEILGDGLAEK